MNFQIYLIERIRNRIKQNLEGFNVQQLNYIPKGFNNNLIWHIGHLSAIICLRVYKPAGLDFPIDSTIVETYKPNTKPEKVLNEQEIAVLFITFDKVINQLKIDYESGKFTKFEAWQSMSNDEIKTLEEALAFMVYHEGLHFGYILALKRSVLQENL